VGFYGVPGKLHRRQACAQSVVGGKVKAMMLVPGGLSSGIAVGILCVYDWVVGDGMAVNGGNDAIKTTHKNERWCAGFCWNKLGRPHLRSAATCKAACDLHGPWEG